MLSHVTGLVLPARGTKFMVTSKKLQIVQIDVFTERPLTGNALAVCLDGHGLTTEQMQAIARETNLSETTFVLPENAANERDRGIRVRIFTVSEELPFAGHPTLGTAFVLRDSSAARQVNLDLNVGQVPVRFEESDGKPVFGEMTQVDPKFGATHDHGTVARVTGLNPEVLDTSLPVQTVSTGVAFTVVPLRTLAAIRDLNIDQRRVGEYLEQSGGKFFYFVTRETVDPAARLHARMLFYN